MINKYPQADCVWIASDAEGNVGAFVTGGEGPIPANALLPPCIPIDKIEKAVLQTQAHCDAIMLRKYTRPDSFIALAQRGFFVFDWSDVHRVSADEIGAYEKVCVPSSPRPVSALSSEFQRHLASSCQFNIEFGTTAAIDPRTQVACVESNSEPPPRCVAASSAPRVAEPDGRASA